MRSTAEKRRIVEETLVDGASVAAVARRHDVNANLVFCWRRLYRQGLLGPRNEPGSTELVAVQVQSYAAGPPVAVTGEIEIELPGEVRLRLRGSVDKHALADVLSVLTQR